jgi:hypothetical protein
MNEPETTNEATSGECGDYLLGCSLCGALDFDLGDVVCEPFACPVEGEDADTAVAGAAVGMDDMRGKAGVVSYLSILTL